MSTRPPRTDPLLLTGGCHCRAVRFTVALHAPEPIVCNCSICTMKGFVHLIVERDALTIHSGADQLSEYRFHTRTARHTFCATCGIHPFYVPRSHPGGFSVNAHCLDDQAIVETWTPQPFDGQHWEENIDTIR